MPGPITQRDYYDTNPPSGNSPGDIWTGLPTMGLLPFRLCSGVVITPSCDLANRKAETITYLPAVPVNDWFKTLAFLPEVRRTLDGQWKVLSGDPLLNWPDGFRLPETQILESARMVVEEEFSRPRGEKERTALTRCKKGLSILTSFGQPSAAINVTEISEFMGENTFRKLVENLTKNNARPDTHFLPQDNQAVQWAALKSHSLVLFRYPITAPVDIFEAAQDLTILDWKVFLKSLLPVYSAANFFDSERPTKRARLKPPFISDLLSRYLGLNMRLGSPDFTPTTIEGFVQQLCS